MSERQYPNIPFYKKLSFQRQLFFWGRWVIALFLIAFAVFPIIWIISASFNPASSLASQKLIPSNANLDNYKALFNNPIFPFPLWLWNSVKVGLISTAGSVFITTLAAFAFSRFRFFGRRLMMQALLLIQVFPSMLAIVAVYLLMSQFGDVIPRLGLDSHAGLVLIYLGGSMGINVWLMKGFIDTVPRDIDESAAVDGATHWQIFTQLLFPLLRPILAVVGILTFIGTFGDFILARILLKSADKFTLMVGLQIYTAGQFSQKWGIFAAGALLGAFPLMLIYLALQDQIVGGLTQGAVKG
jgi:ABC-type maltose transport system permease subunit